GWIPPATVLDLAETSTWLKLPLGFLGQIKKPGASLRAFPVTSRDSSGGAGNTARRSSRTVPARNNSVGRNSRSPARRLRTRRLRWRLRPDRTPVRVQRQSAALQPVPAQLPQPHQPARRSPKLRVPFSWLPPRICTAEITPRLPGSCRGTRELRVKNAQGERNEPCLRRLALHVQQPGER